MNIIVGRNGKKSVRKIIAETTVPVTAFSQHTLRSGARPWRVNFQKVERGFEPIADCVTINWAHKAPYSARNATIYNGGNGIYNSSNKTRARMMLKEAGVPIPETVESHDFDTILTWLAEGHTLISRPNKHLSGKHFDVITKDNVDIDGFYDGGYVSKFFKKTQEYRVHASVYGVFRVQRKTPREDMEVDTVSPRPWNHSTGQFKFKRIAKEYYDKRVCKLAIDGLKALGLDFGAVDILGTDDEFVITEVNTSPSVDGTTITDYAEFFSWLGQSSAKRVPMEYDESTTKFHYRD